jgi:hypothetical protein
VCFSGKPLQVSLQNILHAHHLLLFFPFPPLAQILKIAAPVLSIISSCGEEIFLSKLDLQREKGLKQEARVRVWSSLWKRREEKRRDEKIWFSWSRL